MRFATARVRAEWADARLDPRLKAVASDVAAYARRRWKWQFTVTSIYRTPEEDKVLGASGIHCEWRALDVRTRGRSLAAIEDVARYANSRWIYDPKRPRLVICFTEPHGTGPHAHFQVHANTRLA